jgi:hypothetical protein
MGVRPDTAGTARSMRRTERNVTLSPEVWMSHDEDPVNKDYPHGRGYGHDYMRGGEVFGGYGYAAREEYETPRGSLPVEAESTAPGENGAIDEEPTP